MGNRTTQGPPASLLIVATVPKPSSNCRQTGLQHEPPVQKEALKHLGFDMFPHVPRVCGCSNFVASRVQTPVEWSVRREAAPFSESESTPRPQAGDVLFGAVCSALHLAAQNDPVRETTPSAQHDSAIYLLSLRPLNMQCFFFRASEKGIT